MSRDVVEFARQVERGNCRVDALVRCSVHRIKDSSQSERSRRPAAGC